MLAVDSAALECDLAETYGIFEYRELPARKVALFACGLSPDTRIGRKLCGMKVSEEVLLLATIVDALKILIWQNTKDGAKGRNRPKPVAATLIEEKTNTTGFDTPGEFMEWRARMMGDGANGE